MTPSVGARHCRTVPGTSRVSIAYPADVGRQTRHCGSHPSAPAAEGRVPRKARPAPTGVAGLSGRLMRHTGPHACTPSSGVGPGSRRRMRRPHGRCNNAWGGKVGRPRGRWVLTMLRAEQLAAPCGMPGEGPGRTRERGPLNVASLLRAPPLSVSAPCRRSVPTGRGSARRTYRPGSARASLRRGGQAGQPRLCAP